MQKQTYTEHESEIIAKVCVDYEAIQSDSDMTMRHLEYSDYKNMGFVIAMLKYEKHTITTSQRLSRWLESHGCQVYIFADEYYVTLELLTMQELMNLKKTESFTIKSDNPEKPWVIKCTKNALVLNARDEADVWPWEIDGQYFNKTAWANNYMVKIVQEKLTGNRIIGHKRGSVPKICGSEEYLLQHKNDGRGCHTMTDNKRTNLCSGCPIAEMLDAERDGVKLEYQSRDVE